ncbi:hypothetical protein EJ05DRAFT_428235, partial [Pseudovirgaria hyperparasitica]
TRLGGPASRTQGSTTSFLTIITLIYAIGAGITAAANLNYTYSNYKTQKSPVLVFIITTSPCRDWVIYAPTAFLRYSSYFLGSLSGIEP